MPSTGRDVHLKVNCCQFHFTPLVHRRVEVWNHPDNIPTREMELGAGTA